VLSKITQPLCHHFSSLSATESPTLDSSDGPLATARSSPPPQTTQQLNNMQMRAAAVPQGLRVKAFQGTRVAAPAALRPGLRSRTALHTSCGATPKGLPVSVSTYDDDLKEKSRKFRRTVSSKGEGDQRGVHTARPGCCMWAGLEGRWREACGWAQLHGFRRATAFCTPQFLRQLTDVLPSPPIASRSAAALTTRCSPLRAVSGFAAPLLLLLLPQPLTNAACPCPFTSNPRPSHP